MLPEDEQIDSDLNNFYNLTVERVLQYKEPGKDYKPLWRLKVLVDGKEITSSGLENFTDTIPVYHVENRVFVLENKTLVKFPTLIYLPIGQELAIKAPNDSNAVLKVELAMVAYVKKQPVPFLGFTYDNVAVKMEKDRIGYAAALAIDFKEYTYTVNNLTEEGVIESVQESGGYNFDEKKYI